MDRAVLAGFLVLEGAVATGCLFNPTGSPGATEGGSSGGSSGSTSDVTTSSTGEPTGTGGTSTTSTSGASSTGEGTTVGEGSSSGAGLPESYCGDGKVDPEGDIDSAFGEECDDGDLLNDNACTNLCVLQSCGDGFIDLEQEECDAGGVFEGTGCDADCKCSLDACGDGELGLGEECDDGNTANRDGCSACCQRLHFTVFVSSKMFAGGALNNLNGADAECNALAAAAGLPGVYQAWAGPARGVVRPLELPFTRAYALTTGVIVAHSVEELRSGQLAAAIDVDEKGQALGPTPDDPCADPDRRVWTGTDTQGVGLFDATCGIWSDGATVGRLGAAGAADVAWVDCQQDVACTTQARLYCFEVQPG